MRIARLAALLLLSSSPATASTTPFHLIPGRIPLDWQGPDGNTIVLDAPDGLIVVDTGRSPQHAQAIIDYARRRDRPIAAIVNTHWHLDHTTGNADIREAYPQARVYASTAIEGALASFLGRNREQTDKLLADPKTPAGQKAQALRGRSRIDHPDTLRPTNPVLKTGPVRIAGRSLEVHLAKFAATEGDVWLYDRKSQLAIVGDLVVGIVPFMDTACPHGWSRALEAIAATPFRTLVPGHGPVMNRGAFLQWRRAYNNFVDCGESRSPKARCIAGWMKDANRFIPRDHRAYVRDAAGYYLDSRLRSSPAERQRYCKTLLSRPA
jgi:glyoxylase-like metal-dependent hydrolase (beta-lactamase superfamily II)